MKPQRHPPRLRCETFTPLLAKGRNLSLTFHTNGYDNCLIDHESSDQLLVKKFWSGRPGSNRRRPAWEFYLEFDVFWFQSKNLVDLSRSSNLRPSFNNFN